MMKHNITITIFFFFNDTATTEIYTLSLHDALPILVMRGINDDEIKDFARLTMDREWHVRFIELMPVGGMRELTWEHVDRKSTRLNSSHSQISYAVFCLKKKKRI